MLILYLFLLPNFVFGSWWKLPIMNYQLLITNYQKRSIAKKLLIFLTISRTAYSLNDRMP